MASTPTDNFGYDKPAAGDRGWGTTMNTNLTNLDVHLAAEHRSSSGNEGKHGPNLTILNSNSTPALDITQSAGSAVAVNITNSTTTAGDMLSINCNSSTGSAVSVTSTHTNNYVTLIDIDDSSTNSGGCTFSVKSARKVGAGGAKFENTSTHSNSSSLAVSKAAGTSGRVLKVTNDGNGIGIDINHSSDGVIIDIDCTNAGSGIMTINQSGASGGAGITMTTICNQEALGITANGTHSNAHGIELTNSGGGKVLWLKQYASGIGIDLDYNHTTSGNAAIDIDTSNPANVIDINKTHTGSGSPISINNSGTGVGIYAQQVGTGYGLQIRKTATSGTTALLECTSTANTSTLLSISHSGTGNAITVSPLSSGKGIFVNKTTVAAGACIDIMNSGTGHSINITQNGDQIPIRVSMASGNTYAAIYVTNSGSGHHFDTDAGSGTAAHLTNGGVWTDASCFREFKEEIEELDAEALTDVLDRVSEMPVARYYDKADKAKVRRRRFGPFQDELVDRFGLDPRGVSPVEVATIALAAVKALKAEMNDLKKQLGQ